jgi:prefoldin subunit 5
MSIDKLQEQVDKLLEQMDELQEVCDTLPQCEEDDGCATCETNKRKLKNFKQRGKKKTKFTNHQV